MKKRLAMLFALCLMTGVLSSCGKDTSSTETTKKDDNTLVILNYGKYIDESVLDQFEKETGIKQTFPTANFSHNTAHPKKNRKQKL